MSYGDFYKGKKVAVPGGEGFLGTVISAKLREAGAEVFVPSHKAGIDFRKKEVCEAYMNEVKPEIVINCAAHQGGIGYHSGKQADLFMDNIQMGLFLMQASQASGVKKFINVVAGCTYPGYLEKEELNEEDYWMGDVHESIFSYGASRKASVSFGKALFRQYGFNSIHLILANMYGPGEHFEPSQSKALAGLMKKFYEAKKNNAPRVEVWGTGKPERDWLYVKDGAEGILRAGASYDDIAPMNISTGASVTVKDLAETMKRITGYGGEIFFDASKPDGAIKKTFGNHRMKERLNWTPETSLENGIKETLAWFDKNYETAIHY